MHNRVLGLVWIWLLLWSGVPLAHGQRATELFIPVGQSPGLSGTVTVIGTLDSVNQRQRTITVAGVGEVWTAEITEGTKIWVDRSQLPAANQVGSLEDLRRGLTVEVKYRAGAQRGKGPAEWIKVQLPKPAS